MEELYEKIVADESLQERAVAIIAVAAKNERESAVSEFMKLADELGCKVTEEQLYAYFEDMFSNGELSDAELDLVAGGMVKSKCYPPRRLVSPIIV